MPATLDKIELGEPVVPRSDGGGSEHSVYREAVQLLQRGNYKLAEERFFASIRGHLRVADSYNGLGIVYQRQNKMSEAIASFREAIESSPGNAEAHFNLGLAYKSQNSWPAALASFGRAMLLQPSNTEFLAKYAEACTHTERIGEAIASLEQYVVRKPDHEYGWLALAPLYLRAEATAAAIRCYREVCRISSANVVALNNLGWLLHNSNQCQAAQTVLEQAVEQFPQECALWRNLGETYQKLARNELAFLCFTHAVDIGPADGTNHYQLGYFFSQRGKHSDALEHFRRASSLNGNSFDAFNMLANTHVELGEAAKALPLFKRAIAIDPSNASVHVNLAVALRKLGLYADAAAAFDHALEANPGHAEAQFGKALLALLQGDFTSGWKGYEARRMLPRFVGINELDALPRWRGEPLREKSLFVHAEQGLGDTIQFVRYLAHIQQEYRPKEIVFACDPKLEAVFKYTPGYTRCVFAKSPPMDADYHVNLLSIPAVVGTQIETIPNSVPYVFPDTQKAQAWAKRLHGTRGLRVGFVWRGSPTHVNDRDRSCKIDQFMALTHRHQTMDFMSLQVEPTRAELRALHHDDHIQDLGSLIHDFSDTAAILNNLHLVISVDTAVAHLAGAMGKPAWILLSFNPDWRWLLDRPSSPWYPSVRLFRQGRPGDWQQLFDSVDQALGILSKTFEAP